MPEMLQDVRPIINFTEAQFKEFKEMMLGSGYAFKHDPTGTPVPSMYANGGLFSYPQNPVMYSALQQPSSFIDTIPLEKSLIQNEVSGILTGMTDASGSNPADVCGVPATPGNLKICRVNLQYGKAFVGSKVKDVTEVGLLDSWAVNPIQIRNMAMGASPLVPEVLRMTGVNFASDSALRNYEVATMLARIMARVEIDGDASLAYTATELGWIKEPNGLSRLIKADYTDIEGAACPAADSLVEAWDAAAGGSVNGLTLVQLLHDMYFSRMELARKVGMENTNWYWVMDERLFRQVVFLFSCTYAMARCTDGTDGEPITRAAAELERRFNEMYNGRYLLIAGKAVPVRFSSGAEVTYVDATTFEGSIFLVPESWNGAALLKWQYFPMNNASINEFNAIGNTTGRFSTNDGLYMFATRSSGYCDQLLAVTKLRMKLETPFLAARIDGISFNSYVGYRNWNPAGSSFYNGGTTFYTGYFGD